MTFERKRLHAHSHQVGGGGASWSSNEAICIAPDARLTGAVSMAFGATAVELKVV